MIAYTHLFGNKNRLAVKQWFPTFLMPRPFNTVPHVVVTPLPCLEEATSPLWQAIENFPLQAPSANRSLRCHRLTPPPTYQAELQLDRAFRIRGKTSCT